MLSELWKQLCQKRKKNAPEQSREKDGKENKKITMQDIGLVRLLIIVLAGIFLLVLSIPTGKTKESGKQEDTSGQLLEAEDTEAVWSAVDEYARKQEEKLQQVLEKVDGVGKVNVMITLSSSEEKITLQNKDYSEDITSENDSAGGSRNGSSYQNQEEPILIEGEDGEQPYVVQIQAPSIEGVVVVAQGAGSGSVDMEIIQAVEALFPIESHKIKVMKMS